MRLATLLFAVTALQFVPACSTEAAGPAGVYSVAIDTTGMPEEQVKVMQSMMKPGDCTLLADRTWESSMEVMGKKSTVKGTWVLEGDKITMTATEEDGTKKEKPDSAVGIWKDGTITVEMKEEGAPQPLKMIMKRKP